MKNWIFFAGAPGSRWSGVSRVFRDNLPNVDNTDMTPDKKYESKVFAGHVGNYYGPGEPYGDFLKHRLGTIEEWQNEIERSYSGSADSIKLILSHHFSYYIKEIKEQFTDSRIVLCYRPDEECLKWWHEAGGWNITHPRYDWYVNDDRMLRCIKEQNQELLKHGEFSAPDINLFRREFDTDVDFIFDRDVQVCII